jgi:hypothetical protein
LSVKKKAQRLLEDDKEQKQLLKLGSEELLNQAHDEEKELTETRAQSRRHTTSRKTWR